MQPIYQPSDTWSKLCDQIRSQLQLDSKKHLAIYPSFIAAAWESILALGRLWSHKKEIVLLKPIDVGFQDLASFLSSDSFLIHQLAPDEVASADIKWASVLCIIGNHDDFLTGEIFYPSAKMADFAKEKKTFYLELNHHADLNAVVAGILPTGACIMPLNSHLTVMVGGDRWRIEPLIAPRLFWSEIGPLALSDAKPSSTEKVKKFESTLGQGFKPYFNESQERVFDRAVFYSDEFDGSAVVEMLLQARAGAKLGGDFETLSQCRWNDQRLAQVYQSRGVNELKIRGTVIVDSDQIDANLASQLEQIAKNLKAVQGS